MLVPDDLMRLRSMHYDLGHLPDAVNVTSATSLDIVEATVDDIAFAIIAAEQKVSAAIRRSSALKRLFQLARESGGVGTDGAVEAALKRETR